MLVLIKNNGPHLICRLVALCSLLPLGLFFSLNLYAETSSPTLSLQNYPHARVVFNSQAYEDDYILALGSYKKTDGIWNVDRQERLSGQLTRMTLELPQTHNAEDGFQFYIKQLQNFNLRELYRCDARECGPSNSWANNHFKIIQLYGLDQNQHYAAFELTEEDRSPYYVSIYAVLRGNKRVYVQVDILHSDQVNKPEIASDPDTLSRLLWASGYYLFPDLVIQNSKGNTTLDIRKGHLQALTNLLQRQAGLQIALVGHDYSPVSLAQQQQDSLAYAEELKAALVKNGIEAKRISVYGLGSLAPAGRKFQRARIEVVRLAQ